jgi:hypothetical protein
MTDPGPIPHEYLGASWGCWEAFGEVRAREMSEPGYGPLSQRTVDTYAIQHPGEPGRRQSQSVAVHLMSLCMQLERGVAPQAATRRIAALTHLDYEWLAPPVPNGDLTILDVHRAQTAESHLQLVERWTDGVWRAWSIHHETIRGLLDGFSR